MSWLLDRGYVVTLTSLVVACAPGPLARPAQPSTPASPAAPSVVALPAAPQQFADPGPGLAFRDPDRRAKLASAFTAVDAAVEAERKQRNLPGLALGIVIDGELAYAKGFGVADLESRAAPDADTVYRIGSISKSFTGLAILALRDDGALDLDDPLTRWIPEAAGLVYPSRDARPITLRQLATHSAGLPRMGAFDPDHAPTEQVVVGSLAGLALDGTPGMASSYSNLGFSLLGIVAGRAAHASLHDVIARRVLEPLAMTSTFWGRAQVPPARLATAYKPDLTPLAPADTLLGAADGAGGLYSTVRDMARYAALQLSAYPPRDDADRGPIRRATLREAHSTGIYLGSRVRTVAAPQRAERLLQFETSTYGFGWQRDVTCDFDDMVGHSGAIDSYRADLRFLTSRGVAVIVLTNFAAAEVPRITDRVLETLLRTGALDKRSASLSPAFASAMTAWLDVYNTWNEAAFAAVLARPPDPSEPAELAGYKQLHGACTSFAPLEVISPQRARLQLACERGPLELDVTLATSGRIRGFAGTSRVAHVPAELRNVADGLVALTSAWDDAVFKRVFKSSSKPRAAAKAYFDDVRVAHGACKLAAAIHRTDWSLELACERGGGVEIALTGGGKPLDDYKVEPVRQAGCPVR